MIIFSWNEDEFQLNKFTSIWILCLTVSRTG
jgi:hypothetical protein